MLVAGSAKGFMELEEVIKSGSDVIKQALENLNVKAKSIDMPKVQGDVAQDI